MKIHDPIAIVGMAGLFPGALDLDQFWRIIAKRQSAIKDVHPGRWTAPKAAIVAPGLEPDKAYSTRCGLIEGFEFDPGGIDLPELSPADLDPLHQITLHVGREAIASLKSEHLPRQRTSVILAAIALPTDGASALCRKLYNPSATLPDGLTPRANGRISGSLPSYRQRQASRMVGLPAALLAQAFGLEGGAYTLDAACASSLYAVKLGCDALQSHQSDAVVVGGISRPDCLYTQVGFSQLQALSPSGRCAPFDASADGLVVGEGAGMLILKRLDDALDSADVILGIVRGVGLSNDMRGNLLAPDAEGQLQAMKTAYRNAAWQPTEVDLIECHGAGTPRGDQTEMLSLQRLWQNCVWAPHQCPIGSVKSNIGHLLTAAGAAGLIKVLLALKHRQLPPSLNFERPPDGSPLHQGPFRVQNALTQWRRRKPDQPRRAAVSAFGFGGINAHLLVEEWVSKRKQPVNAPAAITSAAGASAVKPGDATPVVAIVGMGVQIGALNSLRQFQNAVFNSVTAIAERPQNRWHGIDALKSFGTRIADLSGSYREEIEIAVGEFRIPPSEIPDILPQHLLMLKAAAQALSDAGMPLRDPLPRVGTVIGIDFDFEATNYHLGWVSGQLPKGGKPLTANRTLGALGSMVASRIAREFQFGGPSFTVSGEATAGLNALQIGLNAIVRSEVEAVLVGAVDMAGDLRKILSTRDASNYSDQRSVLPFDDLAGGTLPGDGAAALIIKRLDHAVRDGNRIYAIVKGVGAASGDSTEASPLSVETVTRSITRACVSADIDPLSIAYVETHGCGIPSEDTLEANALQQIFSGAERPIALGSTKHLFGNTGAASGLVSLVKASLCLYHGLIAPMNRIEKPVPASWQEGKLHLPHRAQFWFRNRGEGLRRALTAAHTNDGTCMHAVLEEVDPENLDLEQSVRSQIDSERRQPLGRLSSGLFAVSAATASQLPTALDRLAGLLTDEIETAAGSTDIAPIARRWYQENEAAKSLPARVCLLAENPHQLLEIIETARRAVSEGIRTSSQGVWYIPEPDIGRGKLAFIFPGSGGNHYLGMGRDLGVRWPEILREIDAESEMLLSQALPEYFMPYRSSWSRGWQNEAYQSIIADPLTIILGQVTHGDFICRLIQRFGVQPHAVIGYSLGEVTGLVAMQAWPERDLLHARMLSSDLFASGLVPPYTAARRAWQVPADQPVDWRVAVVRRPKAEVLSKCRQWHTARLLIVNTDDECVIGGLQKDIEGVLSALDCEAVFLEGVSSVHCDALQPVAETYRSLHLLPVKPPDNVNFYGCAAAAVHRLSADSAADSILRQGLEGFHFPALIESAYADGIRIFLEMGPSSSCTRMISRILTDRPHAAQSACVKGEADHLSILKALAMLLAAGLPVDLKWLYDTPDIENRQPAAAAIETGRIQIPVGGKSLETLQTASVDSGPPASSDAETAERAFGSLSLDTDQTPVHQIMKTLKQSTDATALAHESFLDFSDQLSRTFAETLELQNRLLAAAPQSPAGLTEFKRPPPAFTRDECLEFARGSAAKVLGPQFSALDSYTVRVRLPDEPLMLVDRILSIEGKKGTLGSGRIVTEHDVSDNAWYLDGDRAPVCIAVEAGQADLFLCAYMGIDLVVKGMRTYRLLDATVTFHRGLPRPGETIQYDIHIDKFLRQADTYMFLFRFEGHIAGKPLITMTSGCAGFFTPEEVLQSGGIITGAQSETNVPGKRNADWLDLVPMAPARYDEDQLDALRRGDAGACFGSTFADIQLPEAMMLPGGRMRLIHRIRSLDPAGGRFGLGRIQAVADIDPEDWFLTCHFVDDKVMPGTLMYECCAHAFRVLLQRYGWICDNPGACYEPVAGVPATLKCRGPVTPQTKQVLYEIEIKEIGYRPQPYAIADAHMYADGHRIVRFENMSMQLTGATRSELESFWRSQRHRAGSPSGPPEISARFNRRHLETFAAGLPSRAFGRPYRPFDSERFIARLPKPPFLCIDRIVKVEPEPWVLKPDGWVEAQYELIPQAWYFLANRCPSLPLGILMEIALQPCGWLAAYMGSALKSDKDLCFRNLGGEAVLHRNLGPEDGLLSIRTRLTQVSEIEDMIIEHFEFQVNSGGQPAYEGTTYFGFFTSQALAKQDGLRQPISLGAGHVANKGGSSHDFEDLPPLDPEDRRSIHGPSWAYPAKALRMIDRIESFQADGGPKGLGYICGTKKIDPDEWFFKAHFHEDPVCPGSLGIESFIQVLKYFAAQRYSRLMPDHQLELLTAEGHRWVYRGQIVPRNSEVTVEAGISELSDDAEPTIRADGLLSVDGLPIYHLENFGIRLLRRKK